MRSACVVAAACIVFLDGVAARAADAGTAAVTWNRDSADPYLVVGRIEVEAAPDAVWARLRDVEAWPRLFSDIRSQQVTEHSGDAWTLSLDTVIFNCGPHDYKVRVAERTVAIAIDAPGIDATVRMSVTATGAGRSLVEYSLRAKTAGFVGLFVPDSQVRAKQQAMVERYLGDVAKAFPRATSAAAPSP